MAEANDLQFIETSAKNGENVEQAFGIATANVLRKIEMGEINPLSDVHKILQIKYFIHLLIDIWNKIGKPLCHVGEKGRVNEWKRG